MKIISCEYNIHNGTVDIVYDSGNKIAIDVSIVENELEVERWKQSEFDRLAYDAPLEFAALLLSGKLKSHLKANTVETAEQGKKLITYFKQRYDAPTAQEIACEFMMRDS